MIYWNYAINPPYALGVGARGIRSLVPPDENPLLAERDYFF
jgi:hypothetical protein